MLVGNKKDVFSINFYIRSGSLATPLRKTYAFSVDGLLTLSDVNKLRVGRAAIILNESDIESVCHKQTSGYLQRIILEST
jgi:hypothetical protein